MFSLSWKLYGADFIHGPEVNVSSLEMLELAVCSAPEIRWWTRTSNSQKPNALCFLEVGFAFIFSPFSPLFFNFDGWRFVLQWVLICVAVEQFQLSKTTTKSNISIFLKKRLQRFQIFLKCFCFILTWHKSFVCILASAIVTAVFNECKMIRKTSFTVGCHCQQMTGERQYCNKRDDEVVHTTTDEVFLTQTPRYEF